MSSGDVRRVSRQDIQLLWSMRLSNNMLIQLPQIISPSSTNTADPHTNLPEMLFYMPKKSDPIAQGKRVQNLIERCIQLYMNEKEVVETLLVQAKIEPGFTQLVWQKLEEENREFFKAYHVRLMVKHQIMIFNELLEKQVEFMRKMCPGGVGSLPISNGSNSSSLNQSPCFVGEQRVPPSRLENMHQPVGPAGTLVNGGPSLHGSMHSADNSSVHTGRMDAPSNMLSTQNSHMGMMQGGNGVVIKSESGYSNNSAFTYDLDGSVLESRPTIGDSSVTSFSSVEPNSHPLDPSVLDTQSSAYGFLAHIPSNFSLTDLSALANSSELESYSRSPFLATDTDGFLDSPGRECQGDNRRLDTISEGLSYDEFGSD